MDSPGGYQLVGRTVPIWNSSWPTASSGRSPGCCVSSTGCSSIR
ncbi:hypothetical protein [Niveispirillum sp. SYP-B3756]|nr:hypothetical protein [Niveispirillum sp. SYP-B3756]